MARKTKEVPITAEGRDFGKTFLITEMPSWPATKWAMRALGAMARSGLEIPPHVLEMGMLGVTAMGLRAILGADFKEAEPLLDELRACVQIVGFPNQRFAAARVLIDDDVEEPRTWLTLQSEVLELHTGFSVAAFLLRGWAEAAERVVKSRENLHNSQTSQEQPQS